VLLGNGDGTFQPTAEDRPAGQFHRLYGKKAVPQSPMSVAIVGDITATASSDLAGGRRGQTTFGISGYDQKCTRPRLRHVLLGNARAPSPETVTSLAVYPSRSRWETSTATPAWANSMWSKGQTTTPAQ